MSWDGIQFDRPLTMLRREELCELYAHYGYQPDDETHALFPADQISADLALSILLAQDKIEEAVDLLAHAITPRVGVWWAYLCLRMVFDDIKKDFEKDGLTPRERQEKKVDAMVKKLTDTSDIDKMVEDHQKAMDLLVQKLEADVEGKLNLNPFARSSLKLKWIKSEFEKFAARESIRLQPTPKPDDPYIQQIKNSIEREWSERLHDMEAEDVLPPDVPDGNKIFEAIEKKTAAIGPAIEKEMSKHFPLKIKGLPKPVPPARKSAAVEAALRWLLVPSDENGRLACAAAIAAKEGPESLLAYSAFWSSTNLVTDTGVAPTNLALPPLGISKTLLQLALLEGGEMDYDARYAEFLRLGIECADGSCTWDEHGKPVRRDSAPPPLPREDHIFRARYGFGRIES